MKIVIINRMDGKETILSDDGAIRGAILRLSRAYQVSDIVIYARLNAGLTLETASFIYKRG